MSEKFVITVARQFGSGGHEIGERVAELLGIPKYDKELIKVAAKNTDIHEDVLEKADETAASSLLYTLAIGANNLGAGHFNSQNLPVNDKLFILQSEAIREIAEKESALIIGRCADYILRNYENRLSVFIYADIDERKKRISEKNPTLSQGEILDLINKTDKKRASYYNFYTGGKWGKYDNYHLALDSGKLGIEGCAKIIAEAIKTLG